MYFFSRSRQGTSVEVVLRRCRCSWQAFLSLAAHHTLRQKRQNVRECSWCFIYNMRSRTGRSPSPINLLYTPPPSDMAEPGRPKRRSKAPFPYTCSTVITPPTAIIANRPFLISFT